MFYIYLENSYGKLDRYAKGVIDLVKHLLEKNSLDIYVNSNALNFEDFLKDVFEQNPELVDFFSINFIKMFNILSEENVTLLLSLLSNPNNKDVLNEIFAVNSEIEDYSKNVENALQDFSSAEYINNILNSKVYSINEVLNKNENLNLDDFSNFNAEDLGIKQ